jgi:uncharacterized protein with beta-barrel porin domain
MLQRRLRQVWECGSQPGEAWRTMLLGTAAAGALLFGYGRRAYAGPGPCPTVGTTMTCTGDHSDGIATSNPITILNVNNLTADIAPAPGTDGINFTSTGTITINSDTSPFAIITTGDAAAGIEARANGPGAVTVNSTGDIATSGDIASGIYAYASASGPATVTSVGDVATQGIDSEGIEALTYSGAASVTSTGDIATQGPNAEGIRAYAYSSGDATVTSTGDIATQGAFSQGLEARALIGSATVTSTGDIATQGTNARGIEVYASGSATASSTGNIATLAGDAVGIYASGGSSASVTSAGNITAALAEGIFATSAGTTSVASTGNVRSYTDIAVFARGSGTGAVTITSTGDVRADQGSALYARSLGTGAVTVTSNGTLTADLAAIRAIGPGGVTVDSSGDITSASNDGVRVMSASSATVILRSGTVYGAVDGVEFVGGASTGTLRNYASLSGGAYAVNAGGGSDTVHNYGTITGNVDLGAGTNAFNNRAGALFNSGDTVIVGTLTNAGIFAPGGVGAIQSTDVEDNMVQTGSGILAIDINGATSDAVTVSDTADLAGTVNPNLLSLSSTSSFTIVNALTVANDLGLTVADTAAIDYELAFSGGTLVNLLINGVNFAPAGLSGNQTAIANNLDAAYTAGVGGLGPLLAGLGNLQTAAELAGAFDELSPELYSDAQIAALYASLGFANSLLSCRVNGNDTAAIIREGQCLWAGASAVFLDQGTTSSQIGFNQSTGLFAAGAQVALDNVWRLGLGAGFQTSTLETATHATSEGEQAQAGIALKYNPGPFLLAGVVNGGRAWTDTTRPMAFGGFSGTAQSSSGIDIVNGGLRAAYVVGSPELYFKPMVDAAATYLDLGGFAESGGGAANLAVASAQQTVYSIAPSLEIGTEWWWSNGTLVRPFLRAGAAWYGGGDMALSASFLGAPAGVAPFTIETGMDDVMGVVGAGLDVINGRDAVLHVAYDGQLGETTQIHSVALKGSARF